MYLDSKHGNVVDENDSFRACEFEVDLSSKVNKKITVNVSMNDHVLVELIQFRSLTT